MIKKYIEQKAYECYLRLCPYASKIDKSVKPPVQWPKEKSTTQKAFIEGYELALVDTLTRK